MLRRCRTSLEGPKTKLYSSLSPKAMRMSGNSLTTACPEQGKRQRMSIATVYSCIVVEIRKRVREERTLARGKYRGGGVHQVQPPRVIRLFKPMVVAKPEGKYIYSRKFEIMRSCSWARDHMTCCRERWPQKHALCKAAAIHANDYPAAREQPIVQFKGLDIFVSTIRHVRVKMGPIFSLIMDYMDHKVE